MQETCSSDITELAKALLNVQRQLQPAMKDSNDGTLGAAAISRFPSLLSFHAGAQSCVHDGLVALSLGFVPAHHICIVPDGQGDFLFPLQRLAETLKQGFAALYV